MTSLVASDVFSFSHCLRRLWYDYNPPAGFTEAVPDPFEALVQEMGLAHEREIRDKLAEEFDLVEATSLEHTRELMQIATPVIYQAHLVSEQLGLFGKPDFLHLRPDGSYQAADAKLARAVKKEIGIQLAFYRRILGNDYPGIVYLGNGATDQVGPEHDQHLDGFLAGAKSVLSANVRPSVHYSESCMPSRPLRQIELFC